VAAQVLLENGVSLTAVYKFAPNTAKEAYLQAKADLDRGHFTFTDDEVDRLLPEHLRTNRLTPSGGTRSLPSEQVAGTIREQSPAVTGGFQPTPAQIKGS
jgi:hypothetical protein